MVKKYQQVLILLVAVLYVYSVCPLLCAALEQRFCYTASQSTQSRAEVRPSGCCQSPHTGAADETPAESGKSCCTKDLELVIPEDRYNTHEWRGSVSNQPLVSSLPLSPTLLFTQPETFQNSVAPLTLLFFTDYPLSRRGPPFIHS